MAVSARRLGLVWLVLAGSAQLRASRPPVQPFDPLVFGSKQEYLQVLEGERFLALGDYGKALEVFQRAIRDNPKSLAYDGQGQAYERTAEQLLRRGMKRGKAPALKPALRGQIESLNGEALRSYQKAAENFPERAEVQYRLGKAYVDLSDDPVPGGSALAKATELAPDRSLYRLAHARYFIAVKYFDEAAREAEYIRKDRKARLGREAHYLAGRIAYERGDFHKSIAELKRARSSKSEGNLARYYLAKAYQRLQQDALAAQAYRNLIARWEPATLKEADLLKDAGESLAQLEGKEVRRP